jgi:DNA-3-methyladenine glycosylase
VRRTRARAQYVAGGIDFNASALQVAQELIGATLLINRVGGIIVETEAYDQSEPASHGYTAQTPRTQSLFGPPAHAYVYLSYGIHWCLNFVCREPGHAAGVLIRAIEPTAGLATMCKRRGRDEIHLLCSGPGRLGQALGVTPALDGRPLTQTPFRLSRSVMRVPIIRAPRIGISRAADLPWRFGLRHSPWLSHPFPDIKKNTKRRANRNLG